MKKISILVADQDSHYRKNIVRFLEDYFKRKNNSIEELLITEAMDGLDCLCAVFCANAKRIFYDLIISDDTMAFISGKLCSIVLQEFFLQNIITEIPMFIYSTEFGVGKNNINIMSSSEEFGFNKPDFPSIVKNAYQKPLDFKSFEDIMKICHF